MPKAHLTQAFVANAGCEVGKKKTDWYRHGALAPKM